MRHFLLPLALFSPLAAAVEETMPAVFGTEDMLSIATGYTQPITTTPATVSVLTRADLDRLGYRYLYDVLKLIPGSYPSLTRYSNRPAYTLRGAQRVIVLRNGVSMASGTFGDTQSHRNIPLENIERIEILRGTAAAAFPTEALIGVVNLITKDANSEGDHAEAYVHSDEKGHQGEGASLGAGGEALTGRYRLTAQVEQTEGNPPYVKADLQSGLDRLMGTNASLAPGYANTDHLLQLVDAGWQKGGFGLDASYERIAQLGQAVGYSDVLDPIGKNSTTTGRLNLTWRHRVGSHALSARFAGMWMNEIYDTMTLPPGSVAPTPGGPIAYPDGQQFYQESHERTLLVDVGDVYQPIEQVTLSYGAGYKVQDVYEIVNGSNWSLLTGAVMPFTLVSKEDAVMPPTARKNSFAYVQNEWQLAPSTSLMASLRGDRYNDLATVVDPKLALVHELSFDTTLKVIYGQGHRTPAMGEKYIKPNIVQSGNPDLEHERVESIEATVMKRFRPRHWVAVTAYRQQFDNLISIQTSPGSIGKMAKNLGEVKGNGVELEWNYNEDAWLLRAVGSYLRSKDALSGKRGPYFPARLGTLHLNRLVGPGSVGVTVHYVGARERLPSDPRPTLDSFTTADLVGQMDMGRWKLKATVLNLADADGRHPSISANVPDDIPIDRRMFELAVKYSF